MLFSFFFGSRSFLLCSVVFYHSSCSCHWWPRSRSRRLHRSQLPLAGSLCFSFLSRKFLNCGNKFLNLTPSECSSSPRAAPRRVGFSARRSLNDDREREERLHSTSSLLYLSLPPTAVREYLLLFCANISRAVPRVCFNGLTH